MGGRGQAPNEEGLDVLAAAVVRAECFKWAHAPHWRLNSRTHDHHGQASSQGYSQQNENVLSSAGPYVV